MAVSDELYKLTNGNYYFIETQPMTEERKKMGWLLNSQPNYVLHTYKSKEEREKCFNLIDMADVVITAMVPESFLKTRKKMNKLIFRYSERLYKHKYMYLQIP